MTYRNIDVRMLVCERGLKYRDIADELSISPEWLSRLLRNTLTANNKDRIVKAIEGLTKKREKAQDKRRGEMMDAERARNIMQIERMCVLRQDTPECNRDECGCQGCDLIQDADEVVAAYDFVIEAMKEKCNGD